MAHGRRWLATLLFLVPALAHARAGDLDPTFGTGGRAALEFGPRAMVALADGRVVVAGSEPSPSGPSTFALAAYGTDGAPDATFGDGGVALPVLDISILAAHDTVAEALTVDATGGLVVAGTTEFAGATHGIAARVSDDGTIDADFGALGVVPLAEMTRVAGVATTASQVIVAGNTASGIVLDTARVGITTPFFTSPGLDPVANDVAVLDDGTIVVAGTDNRNFLLFRRTNTGPVSSFGTNGFVETDVEPNAIDRIQRIVPLPTRDGRLVVVGSTGVGAVRVVVARYTLDGALDPAFGGTGIVTTSIPGTTAAVPTDALRAPDGAIVVDGKACGAGTCTGFLARYLADGRLDPAFGDGGIAVADLLIAAIAMPDAGHVVATGKDADGFAVERFDLSTCGNGVVEPGEECDDGNTVDGDCCSAACRLEGNGSPCASDGDACTADVCRGAACTHVVPVDAGCATGGASLVVAAGTGATDHRLRLKWTSNGVVGAAAFGDPTRDATPTLCLVDVPSSDGGPVGGPGLVASVDAPAGSRCGAAPCWNETPTGFVYRDAGRRHDGIASLKLASKARQGRIVLKAKGAPVDVPSLAAGDRLLVRLVRDDAPGCFEAVVDPTAATAGRLVAQTR